MTLSGFFLFSFFVEFSFLDQFGTLFLKLIEDHIPKSAVAILINSDRVIPLKDNLNGILVRQLQHFFSEAIIIIFQFCSYIFRFNFDFFLIPFDIIVDSF
jgi:hypothetical protein